MEQSSVKSYRLRVFVPTYKIVMQSIVNYKCEGKWFLVQKLFSCRNTSAERLHSHGIVAEELDRLKIGFWHHCTAALLLLLREAHQEKLFLLLLATSGSSASELEVFHCLQGREEIYIWNLRRPRTVEQKSRTIHIAQLDTPTDAIRLNLAKMSLFPPLPLLNFHRRLLLLQLLLPLFVSLVTFEACVLVGKLCSVESRPR